MTSKSTKGKVRQFGSRTGRKGVSSRQSPEEKRKKKKGGWNVVGRPNVGVSVNTLLEDNK